MADHDHYPDCHRHHMACALLRIWDLEKEVLRLTTQLQHARTGHLTEQEVLRKRMESVVESLPVQVVTIQAEGFKPFTAEMAVWPVPCHDHIEPPIVSNGPTWASHQDDPPSLTP